MRVDAESIGRTLLYVKPAVGFTLPSAGVTPAPNAKQIGTAAGCGPSSLLGSSLGEETEGPDRFK
jgi:hypothetical protein